jgi:hypothetical protein
MASPLSIIGVGVLALLGSASAAGQSSATAAPSTSGMNVISGQQQFASLGQLLDAGGKLMSPQQFKDEIVQRPFVGTLPSGTVIDVMYTSSGMVAGSLRHGAGGNAAGGESNAGRVLGAPQNWPVSGDWTIDDSERVCATLRINWSQGASIMPKRCQFWFRLGDKYYESDSDEDRSAKLLVRVLKQ